MKRNQLLYWAIFAFAAIMGIETGAAIFVTFVVFPVWASSPEAAIGFISSNPYYMEEGDVFMFTSSASMLLSLIIFILAWRTIQPIRKWALVSSSIFIIIFIWSVIYFIPIQDTTFKGEAGTKISREELSAGLNMFVSLNYVRLVMVVITFLISLHLVRLSFKLRNSLP